MIDNEALQSIEKLHEMKASGIISEQEFAIAKRQLLQGKSRTQTARSAAQIGVPYPDDHVGWMLFALKRYADFYGRSSRKEFWMFLLFTNLVALALSVFSIITFGLGLILLACGLLAAIVPLIACQVRRFHDQGKSGWFALLNLIPYVGPFIVLGFMLVPGTEGRNEYGLDPWH